MTKKKPKKRKRIGRTVKQYATFTQEEDKETFFVLGERIKNVKNYMYSRLAGINSYHRLYAGNDIRNEWRKNETLIQQFKLPARFWINALGDVIGNLKSLWSNTCNKIKDTARENGRLTEDEKSYIRYVCSAPPLFGNVLQRKAVLKPTAIENLIIREQYVHNLIRRYARKYRGSIPRTEKYSFFLDADMYEYAKEGDVTYIEMSTHLFRQRIRLRCTDTNVYRKNIRVTFDGERFILAHTVHSKVKKSWTKKNEIGLDKGYKNMLVSSSGYMYGKGLNVLLNQETERLNAVHQKRNRYHSMVQKLEEEGNFEKANRIRENNLGAKKYNRNKNRYDEQVKSYMNHEMNRLIYTENPSKAGLENLTFVSWTKKMPKGVKRKLARWLKGYLDERLHFKFDLHGITITHVNPAYTSQECHQCGCLGERKTQETFICVHCGKINADINASKTIRNRMKDKEITLYTPYRKVKAILQARNLTLV